MVSDYIRILIGIFSKCPTNQEWPMKMSVEIIPYTILVINLLYRTQILINSAMMFRINSSDKTQKNYNKNSI